MHINIITYFIYVMLFVMFSIRFSETINEKKTTRRISLFAMTLFFHVNVKCLQNYKMYLFFSFNLN